MRDISIEKILRWVVLGGVFAMPFVVFVVVSSTYFPFIVAKNLVFRSLVEVTFVAWVALAAMQVEWRPKRSIVLAAVAVFVTVVALADFLGANPIKSVWSNFERMEGLVTLVHLLAYTVVAASMLTQKTIALWFWRVTLAVSSVVSIHAFLQFIDTGKYRLDSTLGNPIYLAVFALFHIFIALLLFTRRGAGTWERVFYALILPLQFWVLFMTATRGAILGVIGGLLLTSLGIAFTLKRGKVHKIIAASFIALILLAVGSFFIIKDGPFVQGNPVLKRFASISLTEGTVFARTVVWGMAWEGVKERPLLGWGQENFSLVFNKHYDPRMYAQEPWFDRTHNVVFDWLVAAGILGLLAYISIFLALLWVIYKTTSFTNIQKWLLVGLLAAYSFHNLTVFDQISSYILFFSIVGWVVASAQDTVGKEFWFTKKTLKSNWLIGLFVLILSGVLVFVINGTIFRANTTLLQGLRDTNRAVQLGEAGNVKAANILSAQGLEKLQLATSMSSTGMQEARELTAQMASRFASTAWMSDELRLRWFAAGVEGLRLEERREDSDARFPMFVARLYSAFDKLEEERSALLRAREISPQKQAIVIELAANAIKRGDAQETEDLLQKAHVLDTAYPTAGALYAIRLILNGEMERFDSTFSDSKYIGADSRVLTVLIENNFHERALKSWEVVFKEASNPRVAFLLASVYAKVEDTKRAAQSIRRAIEIDPRAKDEGELILKTLE